MTFAKFKASYKGDKKSLPDAYYEHNQKAKGSRWNHEISLWNQEERPYEKWKVKEDRPGFVYFFRTVTGWYKFGRTEKWSRNKSIPGVELKNFRKSSYIGPSKPQRIFFVRPVRRMREAEFHLKQFLLNRPNSPYFIADGNEWILQTKAASEALALVRKRTAAARFNLRPHDPQNPDVPPAVSY